MKLIPMEDFVLQMRDKYVNRAEKANEIMGFVKCCQYAMFFKKKLELGMFLPYDEDGNVLEEPFGYMKWLTTQGGVGGKGSSSSTFIPYKKAKEKILFVGDFSDMIGISEAEAYKGKIILDKHLNDNINCFYPETVGDLLESKIGFTLIHDKT